MNKNDERIYELLQQDKDEKKLRIAREYEKIMECIGTMQLAFQLIEIYQKQMYDIVFEMKKLDNKDYDKPQDTNQSTVSEHNGALASTCNSKQETCCNDKTTFVYGAGASIDNRVPLHGDPYKVSTTPL